MLSRRRFWLVPALALCAVAVTASILLRKDARRKPDTPAVASRKALVRKALFAELRPVKLQNCQVERFGEPHDGGYLMCGNLLGSVDAGYSYGIGGYDGWGCDMSRRINVRVHRYDCFDIRQPACQNGDTVFHEECIGTDRAVDEGGRLFDTMENQILKNGDGMKNLVVKIDVEGAEWDAFVRTPEPVFERIDQLAVEFHGVDEDRFLVTVWKLKKFFYVGHLHFNNRSCTDGAEPFPAWAYEVLFVNKRVDVPDPAATVGGLHRLDAPNDPHAPDCQSAVR